MKPIMPRGKRVRIERISSRLLVDGQYVSKVARDGRYLLADDEHPVKIMNGSIAIEWAWRIAKRAVREGKSIIVERESTRVKLDIDTSKQRICTVRVGKNQSTIMSAGQLRVIKHTKKDQEIPP